MPLILNYLTILEPLAISWTIVGEPLSYTFTRLTIHLDVLILQRKVENGKHQNLVYRRNRPAFWTRFSCLQATFSLKLVRIPLIRK
jgi:hypothetical protein